MTTPVPAHRIELATRHGIRNADTAAIACREAGLPFYAACALLEKESGGRNVYGHDKGGVFADLITPGGNAIPVTAENFARLLVLVMNGATSNGVGPCQITYAGGLVNGHRDGGYFRQMIEQRLMPWNAHDNMLFGFRILAGHYAKHGSWVTAGRLYNGSLAYGEDLATKVTTWRDRFRAGA